MSPLADRNWRSLKKKLVIDDDIDVHSANKIYPTGAIIIDLPPQKVFWSEYPSAKETIKWSSLVSNAFEVSKSIVATAQLCCARPVCAIGHWVAPVDPVMNAIVPSSLGLLNVQSPFSTRIRASIPETIDYEDIGRLLKKFSGMPGTQKALLINSLGKLSLFRQHTSAENKAIELRTALELILAGGANSEIAYQMAVRAAKFSDVKIEKRAEIFRDMKRCYSLCSGVIHSGVIDAKKFKDPLPLLENGASILEAAIKRIIMLGKFPDWERDVVLT